MSRLDDLYARYLALLIRRVAGFSRSLSEEDAKDIAQETLIATWKRLEHVPPEREQAYLVVSAYNRAKTHLARVSAQRRGGGKVTSLELTQDAEDERAFAEEMLIEKDEAVLFQQRFNLVMRDLQPETRQAIFLRAQGDSSKQIAEKLGLTDQAVRTRLSRAFELIRARVGEPPSGVRWMSLDGADNDHEQ